MEIPKFLSHMSKEDVKYIYSLPINKRMEKIMFCCDPSLLNELPDDKPDDYDVMKEWLKKQIEEKKLIIKSCDKDGNLQIEWR